MYNNIGFPFIETEFDIINFGGLKEQGYLKTTDLPSGLKFGLSYRISRIQNSDGLYKYDLDVEAETVPIFSRNGKITSYQAFLYLRQSRNFPSLF
jgi:hypothetical protein